MSALSLSDDLIFTSRITGTAQTLGVTVKPVRTLAALQTLTAQQRPTCLIVDLEFPGLDISAWLDWLRQQGAPLPRVVAYGAHVDVATLKHARAAGCDLVLPRSKFVEDLPGQLTLWVQSREHQSARGTA